MYRIIMKKIDLLKKYCCNYDAKFGSIIGKRNSINLLKCAIRDEAELNEFINRYCTKCPPLTQYGESADGEFYVFKPIYSIIIEFSMTMHYIFKRSNLKKRYRYIRLFFEFLIKEPYTYIKYVYYPEKI